MNLSMNEDPLTKPAHDGQAEVFGFGAKLLALYGSGINPKVYNDSTLAETLGIARQAVGQIKSKERPARFEGPAPDGSNTITSLTLSRLVSICSVFGIPLCWFTEKCSKKEFERRLQESTWMRLMKLEAKSPSADFEFKISGSTTSFRGLKPANEIQEKPELGIVTLDDKLDIHLEGQEKWNLILLEREPNGQILSLLPSQWNRQWTLDSKGHLCLPNLKFESNDTGQHSFIAIFHEKPFFDVEVKSDWFYLQFSEDIEATEPERSEAALRKLVNWLEDQQHLKPPCFEVVAKDCLVVAH